MQKNKLSDHIFDKKKNKFIAPFNYLMGDKIEFCPWIDERLPEYFWLAIILNQCERKDGLEKLKYILKKLNEFDNDILIPAFSQILKMNNEKQELFYDLIKSNFFDTILNPLSLIYTYSDFPVFAKNCTMPNIDFANRQAILKDTLSKTSNHQSDFSTDIRFLVVYYQYISGKYHPLPEQIDILKIYSTLEHSDGKMGLIRGGIRASEINSQMLMGDNKAFCVDFWEKVSIMSDCDLFRLNWSVEDTDVSNYLESLHKVFEYLVESFLAIEPLDKKITVLLGMATYSFKIFKEICEHKLYNTLIGRNSIRILIENYIMMKFLILKAEDNPNIWKSYQEYGISAFKKIISHYREMPKTNLTHINYDYIELLVNEDKDEMFQDIDVSYFGGDMRKKAEAVNEKSLWALCYQYGSIYSHGLWGAIRESCMLGCKNPAHHWHCVPDYENTQNSVSVLNDSVILMNKTILILNDIYELPENLIEELNNFEKQLFEDKTERIAE